MKQDRWAFLGSIPANIRKRLDAVLRDPDVVKRVGAAPEDPQEFAAWVRRLTRSRQGTQTGTMREEELPSFLLSHAVRALSMQVDHTEAKAEALARLVIKEGRITEQQLHEEMTKVMAVRDIEVAASPVWRAVEGSIQALLLRDALLQAVEQDADDGEDTRAGEEGAPGEDAEPGQQSPST